MSKYQDDTPNPYYAQLEQLETDLALERTKSNQLTNSQLSLYGNNANEQGFAQWQIDLTDDLDKIYHLLKGDVIKEDEHGNVKYIESDDDDLRPFNEFGVQMIMNIMSFYINRNTLLSNYDNPTILNKVHDFGMEVSDLILCRFKDMMMTTSFEKEFKKEYGIDCVKLPNSQYGIYVKDSNGQQHFMFLSADIEEHIYLHIAEHLQNKVEMYPMIVLKLVDCVHSAYLRALGGGERDSLRKAMIVNQTERIGNMANQPQNNPNKKFSVFNPRSWFNHG